MSPLKRIEALYACDSPVHPLNDGLATTVCDYNTKGRNASYKINFLDLLEEHIFHHKLNTSHEY